MHEDMEISFIAHMIDQLDFALDHIVLQDPNYKRLSLMLIDNALELALHEHAEEKGEKMLMLQNCIPFRTIALKHVFAGRTPTADEIRRVERQVKTLDSRECFRTVPVAARSQPHVVL